MNCYQVGVRLHCDVADFYQTLVLGEGAGDLKTIETFGHVHEIHKRFSSHLLHDFSAVLLDGDFAVVELERDLLPTYAKGRVSR